MVAPTLNRRSKRELLLGTPAHSQIARGRGTDNHSVLINTFNEVGAIRIGDVVAHRCQACASESRTQRKLSQHGLRVSGHRAYSLGPEGRTGPRGTEMPGTAWHDHHR
jgi:hypothetical protein